MDNSLLCLTLKKIVSSLNPPTKALSFIIIIGALNQGKTRLLEQSNLSRYPFSLDETLHHGVNIFYNQQGIILELGETWLNQSKNLVSHSLKQFNRCHKRLKISGLILCIDASKLAQVEPIELQELCFSHAQLFQRFRDALTYPLNGAIIITKLDSLVGFCEFFQTGQDENKALGFSLNLNSHAPRTKSPRTPQNAALVQEEFKLQFDAMIDDLAQQVMEKIKVQKTHCDQTLVREFPLQIASLKLPLQSILEQISGTKIRFQAMYFTSAEQGGLSINKLNQKIQQEYDLNLPDKLPQANNYRAYFINEAIRLLQEQTKIEPKVPQNRLLLGLVSLLATYLFADLAYQHIKTAQALDEISQELSAYERLAQQEKKASALYHLSMANNKITLIPRAKLSLPWLEKLKSQLNQITNSKVKLNFLPGVMATIEDILKDPQASHQAKYQALKIYLMLANTKHFKQAELLQWFRQIWQHSAHLNDKPLVLLKNSLKAPIKALPVNRQLILDTRNYLNALPSSYLHYSLAKLHFPKKKISLKIQGFILETNEIPLYFTKQGFEKLITSMPKISQKLQEENWILARQNLENLNQELIDAYCSDYLRFWKNFLKKARLKPYDNYQQASQLTFTLYKHQSISVFLHFIQEQTKPEAQEKNSLFNEKIAKHFTRLNLISESETQALLSPIHELETFLTTLSLVKEHEKTVFKLTKARFQEEKPSDPLSVLYAKAEQVPKPISNWVKELADGTWFIFMQESKAYLNKEWNQRIYSYYQKRIQQRYPFELEQKDEISLEDFNQFFSPSGRLNRFVNTHIKPFLDTKNPEWKPKTLNGYRLPFSKEVIEELIRANVITNMFFPDKTSKSQIEFSLQKITLDPVIANLELTLGPTILTDTPYSETYTLFTWPQNFANLSLKALDGSHFKLEEKGIWAFFKILQKVNVLVDASDSSILQILFEINGNSGRYQLKTENPINPFSPGILTGFNLSKDIV